MTDQGWKLRVLGSDVPTKSGAIVKVSLEEVAVLAENRMMSRVSR